MQNQNLTNNQVLNMEELEAAAKYENQLNRRPALMLMGAAIFAIVMGFAYPYIMAFVDGTSSIEQTPVDESETTGAAPSEETEVNKITCLKTVTDEAADLVYNYETIIDFNEGLISIYTKNLNVVTSNTTATEYNEVLTANKALDIEQNGYTVTTTEGPQGFTSNLVIDFASADLTALTDAHKTHEFTKTPFVKETTSDIVKETLTTEGYECN